ncbi:MAG TPA: hypothetical protein GX498_00340 [Clostridiales bacterium]|nr:hypothetical protein [Clostridiales bacterium]
MIGKWKGKFLFYYTSQNNGFIIIEVLTVLPILSMIIFLVFYAVSSNINNISKLDSEIEMQQQAQFILDFMESKIIESIGVSYLQDIEGFQKHNTNERVYISKIIFKNPPERSDKGYIFSLSKDSKNNYYNLKYGIGLTGGAADELGNYIDGIEVEPIPSDKKYTEANGIKIKIDLKVEGNILTFENSYYFRNSHRRN